MNNTNTKRPKKPHLSLPCVSRKASQGLKLLPYTRIFKRATSIFNFARLIAMGFINLLKSSYKAANAYPYKKLTAKYSIISVAALVLFGLISVGQSQIKKQEAIETVIAASEKQNEFGQISNTIGWESWDEDFIVPVNGYKSQGYHRGHPGIDYAAEIYTAIHPITTGKVIHTGWEAGGYGITVIVDHDHGLLARYAHMAKTDVKVGDLVKTESILGEVGLTGHTTGPHVHVEIYDENQNINPENFVPISH